jgi:hypothetical protein
VGYSVEYLFGTLFSFSCRCRYFQEVLLLDKVKGQNEVQLHRDGSWSSLIDKTTDNKIVTKGEYIVFTFLQLMVIQGGRWLMLPNFRTSSLGLYILCYH